MARTQIDVLSVRGSTPTVGTATTVANTSAGTSATVNKPTVQDGTLLIVQLSAGGNISSVNAPAGWTLILGYGTAGVAASGSTRSRLYYKYIPTASGEAATTYQWTWTTSAKNSIICLPVYGVSSNQQIDVDVTGAGNVSQQVGQAGGTATPATRYLPTTNMLAVGGAAVDTDAGATLTVPAAMTQAANVGGSLQAIAYETRTTGGGYGGSTAPMSRAFTTSPATNISAWLLLIRPTDTLTWTKPNWARACTFHILNGGHGGGSGRKGASLSNRGGGGGGAGGNQHEVAVDASLLPATGAVIIGGGGAGGTSISTNSQDGVPGGVGGLTTITFSGFSPFGLDASSSSGGSGGTTVGGSGSSASGTGWLSRIDLGSQGSAGGTGAGTAGQDSLGGCAGGGGGAGINSGNTVGASGGAHGGILNLATGTTNTGTSGTAGSSGTANVTGLGPGMGGSGGQANGAGAAGKGGDGALYGGGGGGGGASLDSTGDSGAGGDGAVGAVIVVSVG